MEGDTFSFRQHSGGMFGKFENKTIVGIAFQKHEMSESLFQFFTAPQQHWKIAHWAANRLKNVASASSL